ncbi:hypothetical protein ACVW1A_007782 [Bradyrhizobium sp. LB1.3]
MTSRLSMSPRRSPSGSWKERPELEGRHFSILVTNRDGDEIGRVPLDVLH